MELSEAFGPGWGQRDDKFLECQICGAAIANQAHLLSCHVAWHERRENCCPRCWASVQPENLQLHLSWHRALRSLIVDCVGEAAARYAELELGQAEKEFRQKVEESDQAE